ncbi:MAG: MAPEG family protein [Acidobacteriota bacterium]
MNVHWEVLTADLWAVVATLLLAMVQIGIQSLVTLRQAGGAWVAGPRDEPFEVTGVSGRLVRAHRNLLEIIPQFFASVFLVHLAGTSGQLSIVGSWLFVVSRVLYVPAYAWGPVGLRPLLWQGGQFGILIVLGDLFV